MQAEWRGREATRSRHYRQEPPRLIGRENLEGVLHPRSNMCSQYDSVQLELDVPDGLVIAGGGKKKRRIDGLYGKGEEIKTGTIIRALRKE